MEHIVCQKCGEINPPTNNFCGKCAAPLGVPYTESHIPEPPKKIKSFRIMQDTGIHSLGCFMMLFIGVVLFVIITILVNAAR